MHDTCLLLGDTRNPTHACDRRRLFSTLWFTSVRVRRVFKVQTCECTSRLGNSSVGSDGSNAGAEHRPEMAAMKSMAPSHPNLYMSKDTMSRCTQRSLVSYPTLFHQALHGGRLRGYRDIQRCLRRGSSPRPKSTCACTASCCALLYAFCELTVAYRDGSVVHTTS